MDVEVTKKTGEAFLLSDYGFEVLDFVVSSIEMEPYYEEMEGRSGQIDYGADYKNRDITVPFWFKAENNHDFPLARDQLFQLLNSKDSFYIRELRMSNDSNRYTGGKRYLVRNSNPFVIDQEYLVGQSELEFETPELPFAESVGTTLDIDPPELAPAQVSLWEQGGISTGGNETVRTTTIRLKEKLPISPGKSYKLTSNGNYSTGIRTYDKNGKYITGGYTTAYKNDFKIFESPENARSFRLIAFSYEDEEDGKITPKDIGKLNLSLKLLDDSKKLDLLAPYKKQENWENSYISVGGIVNKRKTSLSLIPFIEVTGGDRYEFHTASGKNLYLREYLEDKSFNTEPPSYGTANGSTRIIKLHEDTRYIRVYFNSDFEVFPEDIENGTLDASVSSIETDGLLASDELWSFGMGLQSVDESLKYTHESKTFKVYNAGNIPIHPFEQELKITISNVKSSTKKFVLKNKTNESEFEVTEGVDDSDEIIIDGPNVTNNRLQYLRKTNKQFIELDPGWNEFVIDGATRAKVEFDFRFYYQ